MNETKKMDNFIKDAKHYRNTINKWIRKDGIYTGVGESMGLMLEDIYGYCRLVYGEVDGTVAEEILWAFRDGKDNDYDEAYDIIHEFAERVRLPYLNNDDVETEDGTDEECSTECTSS